MILLTNYACALFAVALSDSVSHLPVESATIAAELTRVLRLARILNDGSDLESWQAANELGRMGTIAALAASDLSKCIQHRFLLTRLASIDALESIGPAAKPAVPGLLDAAKKEKGYVRFGAARALWSIAKDPAAISAIVQAFLDKDESGRIQSTPGELGGHDIQYYCARTLGRIGADAKSALPALENSLTKTEGPTREAIAEAIWRVGGKLDSVVPVMIESLRDPDVLIRLSAIAVIRDIGPPAKAAVPALIEMLANKDEPFRDTIVETLGGFKSESKVIIPVLKGLCTDDNAYLRRVAEKTLQRLVGESKKP